MTRTRTRLVRAVAAGSTAALLTLAAACGGSSGSGGSDSSDGSSSSSSSSSSGTAEPLTTSDIGQRLPAAFEKARTFSFALKGTTAGQQIQGTGKADVSGSGVASETTIDLGGQQVQARAVDGIYYFKSPLFRTQKPWLKVDPKASSGVGAVLGQLGANADPTKLLAAFGKASAVTRAGKAEVGGTPTTVYDVKLPSSALSAVLGYPESLLKELPDTLTYKVYVDAEDQMRRQDSALTVRGVKTSTSVTFDDFGTKVSISAPPASQVTTQAPLLSGAGG